MGFKGHYDHSIDAKGRVIVPIAFREALGGNFVVTKGFEHCVWIYDNSEWAKFEAKLDQLSFTSGEARKISRFFHSNATDCEIDKQGRTLIPVKLREFAGLEKDVVIVGNGDHVEIWNSDQWYGYSSEDDDRIEDIAEALDKMVNARRSV